MRMPLFERPSSNTLQMRVSRFLRDNHSLIAWHDASANHDKPNVSRDRVLAGLTDAQKAANTTRGSTPGLIDPSLGVAGGMVPYPVLRRGQGQNRKLRTNPATSSQARQPRPRKGRATHVTLRENQLKDMEKKEKKGEEEEEDMVDSTRSMNRIPVAEQERKNGGKAAEFTSPVKKPADNKRRRNNTDEPSSRPEKRIRQGFSRADEEGGVGSTTYGLALDPVLLAGNGIPPALSHHGGYNVQAGTLAWDDWSNPAYHPNRSHDGEALYSNQGVMIGQSHGPSLSKRKRNDTDELHNLTGDRSGRPQKRIRQGSSRADKEAKVESSRYGIQLDPALIADAPIVSAPPRYDQTAPQNEEYETQAEPPAWSNQSFLNAIALGIEAVLSGDSRPIPQHAPVAPLPHLPQTTATATQGIQLPGLILGNLRPWNQIPDPHAKSQGWDDWLNSYLLDMR